ncbi:tryptophan synthase subunit alpha [Patescibacteria group bacterium]|nr:tryptophan synthase subunit alpha [Patescibacteria group bacterium]
MNRIEEKFEKLRKERKKAFITFITAGDPDLETTKVLVLELEKRGADIIELGIPFSDPLADGSIIQRSSRRALEKGISLNKVLDLVAELRQKTQISLILMGYYNPIFKFGEKKFIEKSSQVGLDGLIVADLPPEEAYNLRKEAERKNIDIIFLLTPVSSEERIKLVCECSKGFIYCVSYTGVTGGKVEEMGETLKHLVDTVRSFTSDPIGVGFGVSSPLVARKIASIADGVIVGSAIIKEVEKYQGQKDLVKKVGDFGEKLAKAVKA